jgi:hypothetical protein
MRTGPGQAGARPTRGILGVGPKAPVMLIAILNGPKFPNYFDYFVSNLTFAAFGQQILTEYVSTGSALENFGSLQEPKLSKAELSINL